MVLLLVTKILLPAELVLFSQSEYQRIWEGKPHYYVYTLNYYTIYD